MSADDSRRVTALDLFNDSHDDYLSAQWSPAGDLILVNTLYLPPTDEWEHEWGPGVYVIDAERDEIILEMTFDILVDQAEWSPDGRFVLVYSSEYYDEESGRITVIPIDGEPAYTHEDVTRRVRDDYYSAYLIWTPDGRLLNHLADTGQLVLEDLATGAIEELPFTTTDLSRVWYSPDGDHGLIYADSELWLHTLSTGTLVQVADDVIRLPYPSEYDPDDPYAPQPSFLLPKWSPDGSRALFATQDGILHWLYPDGTITTLDMPPANEFPAAIPRVQWGGDTAFILWNEIVYIYDLSTESVLATYTEPDAWAYSDEHPLLDAQASSDGRYLAYPVGNSYGYYLWDWREDGEPYRTPPPAFGSGGYSSAQWYPNQDVLFLEEHVAMPGAGYSRWALAFDSGRLFRVTSSVGGAGAPQALPEQVDTSFIPPSAQPLIPGPSRQSSVDPRASGMLAWSPDGRYFASAPSVKAWEICRGGDLVHLYDAVTGERVAEYEFGGCGCGYAPQATPNDPFQGIALTANHSRAAQPARYIGSLMNLAWPQQEQNTILAMMFTSCWPEESKLLLFWDFTADEIVAEYDGVRTAAFASGSAHVALGYDDGRIVLTTYPEMDLQAPLATLPSAIVSLALNADGSRLAVVSASDSSNGVEGELSVWDTTSGTPLFRTASGSVTKSLALTPDGATLLITFRSDPDNEYLTLPPALIDATTGETLTELSPGAFAISPDGQYLAGAGSGLTVWELDTLEVAADFLGNGIEVVWSPDGSQLVAATSYGLYIWDMP
ncbi:MAG: WD40 repeat domain-containing protein [Chloroflexi bacterium]|nr:WD40 repeat domain-containing protein [Chloroflexota bacterium]